MKCFCGKPATHHVKIDGEGKNKFLDHLRCEACKERAERSYKKVEVKELEKVKVGS